MAANETYVDQYPDQYVDQFCQEIIGNNSNITVSALETRQVKISSKMNVDQWSLRGPFPFF